MELPGLVFGEVPGTSDKFEMIHWGAMIILRRKPAKQKPWWIGHAMVGHDITCGRNPHHNVVVLDFYYVAPSQHFLDQCPTAGQVFISEETQAAPGTDISNSLRVTNG